MYTKDVSKYTIECGSVLKGGKIRIIRTHSSLISICEVRSTGVLGLNLNMNTFKKEPAIV